MATTRASVDIDDDALAAAAEVLGTSTTADTVNAALREVIARQRRLIALEELGAMADRGDLDSPGRTDVSPRRYVHRTADLGIKVDISHLGRLFDFPEETDAGGAPPSS